MTEQQLRILMVDDNPDDVFLVRRTLGKEWEGRYTFHDAETLTDGLAFLAVHPTDVLLLDLNLPDSLGMDTVSRVVKDYPNLPVVVLTGHEDQEYGIQAVREGAEDYLFKPEISGPSLWRVMNYSVERKVMATALRKSRERFQLVLQGSNDGTWDWDLETNEMFYSSRWKEMLGYGADEVEDSIDAWKGLTHEEDRDRASGVLDEYLKGNLSEFHLEHRLRHQDGEYRWILMRGVALRDEQGKPFRMAGTITDLTEHIRIEENLRQVNEQLRSAQMQLIETEKMRSIGRLSASIAHEVKNPLATVTMGIAFYQNKLAQEPDKTEEVVLGEMSEAVKRADTIIRGLLDYAAGAELTLMDEDIHAVIEKGLQFSRQELTSHRIEIVREWDEELPPLRIDRNKILQVFINLMENAAQAMGDGGQLTVRTSKTEDEHVLVELEDNGSGIPEESLRQIFDPFYTTKAPGKGTGLGLAVCRNILGLHHAELRAENIEGGGARFTMDFNLQECE